MRSLVWYVLVTVCLVQVVVVDGNGRRTCVRKVQYNVTERYWLILFKDVLKERDGLFCCNGYNPVNKVDHYIEVQSGDECEPFCSPPCPANSACQPPTTCECADGLISFSKQYANKCKCNTGFMPSHSDQCIPICPDHCTNGNCTELTCTCHEGYKKNELEMCVPECSGGCGDYGKCTQKACDQAGYERNEMAECVPKCQNGCLNGKCTAPDNCICNEGYQLNEVNGTCDAVCDNCTNGFCMGPQQCECEIGFKIVEEVCVEMLIVDVWSEEVTSGATGWLVLGVCLGLVVVVTVAIVGFYVTRRILDGNKRNVGNEEPVEQRVVRECESYLQPRCVEEKPGGEESRYPRYESVGDASTILAGQGALPLFRQELMKNLQNEASRRAPVGQAAPTYLELLNDQEDQ